MHPKPQNVFFNRGHDMACVIPQSSAGLCSGEMKGGEDCDKLENTYITFLSCLKKKD